MEFYNYNTKLEDRKASVQYEAPLQGYVNFIPPYPSGVEEGILTFDGWYTNQLFEKKVDINATMPANNIMLYAHWIPKEYTVSFDLGYEGAMDTPATQYVQAKGQATQPDDPVREGFKFLGWYDGDYLHKSNAANRRMAD